MRNKITTLLLLILIIPLVIAEIQTLGTFKKDECIDLKQTCPSCTYQKITSVVYPNSSIALGPSDMSTTDNFEWNYTFCNTNELGQYIVNGYGDVDGTDTTWAYDFEVTPSGYSVGTQGSIVIIGALIVMLILSIAFFILGNKSESVGVKVTMFSIAGVVFLMVILYAVVTIQQVLYGVDGIVSGVETFLTVVKTMVTIGGIGLGIVIFLIILKAWRIRRGHEDEF